LIASHSEADELSVGRRCRRELKQAGHLLGTEWEQHPLSLECDACLRLPTPREQIEFWW
jgi:hypothetical protein